MLRNRLLKELENPKSKNKNFNFSRSLYFCKFVLDIRSFLLFNTELMRFQTYDRKFCKRMFLLTFLSYLRVQKTNFKLNLEINDFLFDLLNLKNDLLDVISTETYGIQQKKDVYNISVFQLLNDKSCHEILKKLHENKLILFDVNSLDSKNMPDVSKTTVTGENFDNSLEIFLISFTSEIIKKLENK